MTILLVGVAKSRICRTIRKYKPTETLNCPKQFGGQPTVLSTYEEQVKTPVRQLVHRFFSVKWVTKFKENFKRRYSTGIPKYVSFIIIQCPKANQF